MLTEALALSLMGALGGVILAYRLLPILVAWLPEYSFPHEAAIRINLPVLGFSVAMALITGVLSGLALIGLTTSADANIGKGYTLLSIAGVILGGGEFVGGRVSPTGAVIGALTLTLAGSLLNFMRVSPDWQVGAQGAILIIVLAARALINRTDGRAS